MSFVFATPEFVAAAASDLANIGSTISSANAAALTPTSGVLAAGADEVSAVIAALFGAHAQAYQALSAQAASFHQQFVELMSGGATQYALTEAANASPLQTVEQLVTSAASAPAQAVTAAPLIGNGTSVPPATAASGGFVALSPGISGGAGQLVSTVTATGGVGPVAAAIGNIGGGGSFGTGAVGAAGSFAASENVGGATAAAASAEELGVSGTPVVAADSAMMTPLAAVPAATAVNSPAMARPATPAYAPAAAESREE
ncbi:MAG: PE family protein [Mycobacterium sp.]